MNWPYRFSPQTRDPSERRAMLDSTGLHITFASLVFTIISTLLAAGWQRSQSKQILASKPSLLLRLISSVTGQREPWPSVAVIIVWTGYVLYMVQWNTSDDYLHITRSCAQVASALLMSNVILSLALLRRVAPAVLSLHRLQALLLFALFVAHAGLYINFYVQNGILARRIQSLDVQLGIGMMVLSGCIWYSGSRIGSIRGRLGITNARYLHVGLTLIMGVMLWFHVVYARANVVRAALVVFLSVLPRLTKSAKIQRI